ncbi:cell redox homeostasis [Sparganum proliferum]
MPSNDILNSPNSSADPDSRNYSWPSQGESVDPNDLFDGKVTTRCRLRPINWWNYTLASPKLVLGNELESALGTALGVGSSDIFGVNLHRHVRISSLFSPFLLQRRYPSSKSAVPHIIQSHCVLVFIYASWCPFSVAAAPYVNALARAFPQLPLIAIDVDEYVKYKWSLRVFYIPKLKIFIAGHVYREFNGSDTDLDEMIDFVWNSVRLLPMGPVHLEGRDFLGPIPSQLHPRNDIRLPLAWLVFLACVTYLVGCFVDYRRLCTNLIALVKRQSDHMYGLYIVRYRPNTPSVSQ